MFSKLDITRKLALVIIGLITGVLLIKQNLKEPIPEIDNLEWILGILLVILVLIQRVRDR